ncbi:MAG: hypothetical protein HYZ53_25065 [Planctomycetes bacterium]|nr:hypothetical protein [Planctomycetota bacterium]
MVRSHISTYAAPAKPSARYVGNPGIGYHYLAWLEATTGTVNATWYGDNGSSLFQSGLVAEVLG